MSLEEETLGIKVDKWRSIIESGQKRYISEGVSNFSRELTTVMFDIDSFFHISESFPDIDKFAFSPYVPFHMIQKPIDLQLCYKGKRKKIREILCLPIGLFGNMNAFYLQVCFPNIPASDLNPELTTIHYELVLRPLLLEEDETLYRIPVNMKSAMEKSRTTMGTLSIKTYHVDGEVMKSCFSKLRTTKLASNSEMFREFFFYIYSKGIKGLTKSTTIREAMNKFESLMGKNHFIGDKDSVFDVGIEFIPKRPNETYVFKEEFLQVIVKELGLCSKSSYDNFAHMSSVGGIRGELYRSGLENFHVLFLQAYSTDKEMFTTKNGFLFDRVSIGEKNLSKFFALHAAATQTLECHKHASFGCRFEVRVSSKCLQNLMETDLFDKLSRAINDIKCIHSFCSSTVIAYRKKKLSAYIELLNLAHGTKKDTEKTLETFRFVSLIQILIKALFSSIRQNSYTKSLIGTPNEESQMNVFRISKEFNAILLPDDLVDKLSFSLQIGGAELQIDKLCPGLEKKRKYYCSYISNLEKEWATMKKLQCFSDLSHGWILKDLNLAIHHIIIVFQTDIISLLPTEWFTCKPNCLKLPELFQNAKVKFAQKTARSWERLFDVFFHPRAQSCRWTSCDFYKIYHKLMKSNKFQQRDIVLALSQRFVEQVEFLPYADDESGRLRSKCNKTNSEKIYVKTRILIAKNKKEKELTDIQRYGNQQIDPLPTDGGNLRVDSNSCLDESKQLSLSSSKEL